MSGDLREAMAALLVKSQSLGGGDDLDAWLNDEPAQDASQNPKQSTSYKRTVQSPENIKRSLEADLLSPPTGFSAQWLNKLQRRWDTPFNYTELCELAPTQSRTVTRFTRESLQGRVTGYTEAIVPATSANAKNSTSLLRSPANRADFVRGAAGFFPFAPGGVDAVDAIAAFEDQYHAEQRMTAGGKSNALNRIINFGNDGGLLEIPPGFSRGLREAK